MYHVPSLDSLLTRSVDVNGVSIRYGVQGGGERTLVLVHGFQAHHLWWHDVAERLMSQYRIVVVDLSGHGGSGHREAGYVGSVFADDVIGVLEAVGGAPVLLVGHSMGGRVCAVAAARRPDLVNGVVLLDSAVRFFRGRELYPWAPERVPRHFETRAEAVGRFRLKPEQAIAPERLARVAEFSVRAHDAGWTWKHDQRGIPGVDQDAYTRALANLAVPLRFVRATASPIAEGAEEFLGEFDFPAGCEIHVAPGLQHHLILEDPDFCATLIDRLAGDIFALRHRTEVVVDERGLVTWQPAPPPVGPTTVADVLAPIVSLDPGRLALIDDDRELTYAELDRRANQIAHVLTAEGLRGGDRLGVRLANNAEVVVLFLAAMRMGLVWVGLNRSLALAELALLIDDAGVAVVVAEPGTELDVARVVEVDEAWHQRVAAASTLRPEVVIDPHAPAAIAYTSGTTGRPKGAVHSQHNMLLPGIVSLHEGSIAPESRQGVVLPLTILNLQILGPVAAWVCGATCVALGRIDAEGLAQAVGRHRVCRVATPPTTAYDLLTHPAVQPDDLATLEELGVGGAGAPTELNDRYRARFGRLFTTSYGLTEAPTAATVEDREDSLLGSAGRALAHLAVAIVGENGTRLSSGVEGQICLGPRTEGPFADVYRPMLGYWNRPDATRATLTTDGWLRTGDQGYLDPDGSLHVVGRRNDLIIRGGANVYPAEVEVALLDHPAVAEAAVIGRPDERLGETVVAVVRLVAPTELEELRQHCSDRLARYKVPAEFIVATDMPHNAMGKIVKKELRLEHLGGA